MKSFGHNKFFHSELVNALYDALDCPIIGYSSTKKVSTTNCGIFQ